MNIYVGNLSPNVSDEDLNGLFSEHGNVSSAKVIRDLGGQLALRGRTGPRISQGG